MAFYQCFPNAYCHYSASQDLASLLGGFGEFLLKGLLYHHPILKTIPGTTGLDNSFPNGEIPGVPSTLWSYFGGGMVIGLGRYGVVIPLGHADVY